MKAARSVYSRIFKYWYCNSKSSLNWGTAPQAIVSKTTGLDIKTSSSTNTCFNFLLSDFKFNDGKEDHRVFVKHPKPLSNDEIRQVFEKCGTIIGLVGNCNTQAFRWSVLRPQNFHLGATFYLPTRRSIRPTLIYRRPLTSFLCLMSGV